MDTKSNKIWHAIKTCLLFVPSVIIGALLVLCYVFVWLFHKIHVAIYNKNWLNKLVLGIARIGDILYMPIYYVFVLLCIILRLLLCLCYVFMFQFTRAKAALKLIFK